MPPLTVAMALFDENQLTPAFAVRMAVLPAASVSDAGAIFVVVPFLTVNLQDATPPFSDV